MKISIPLIASIASPIVAVAVAFGAMQYTKGQDDIILAQMAAKLELIDVPSLTRGLNKLDQINITIINQFANTLDELDDDINELDDDLDEEIDTIMAIISRMDADLGFDFEEIINLRNEVALIKAQLAKLEGIRD